MEPLFDSFASLKEQYSDDPTIVEKIEREIRLGREWVSEKMENYPTNERAGRSFGEVDSANYSTTANRSIFEDVDD